MPEPPETSSPAPQRARGRPARTKESRAETRRHIAACALRLFHAEGFEAVSMRRLAQEAGCTVMTLYAHFDSKLEILHALWAEVLDELFEALEAIAAQQGDPRARIKAVAQGYLDYWLGHREHYFMVFMSGGLSRADVTAFLETDLTGGRYALFQHCLGDALPAQTDAAMLRLRSEGLVCSLNGIAQALITLAGHDWSPRDALLEDCVDSALRR